MSKRFWVLAWLVFAVILTGCGALPGFGIEVPQSNGLPPEVLEEAAIYLPFDGDDEGIGSEPWRNMGLVARGAYATHLGTVGGDPPTVTNDSVKGQAYDSRHLAPMQASKAYHWLIDDITEQMSDLWSFTITMWVKTDQHHDQGRLLNAGQVEVNYLGNRLETMLRPEETWYRSQLADVDYGSIDEWRFIAITYDGAKSSHNLIFYIGGLDDEVAVGVTFDADRGMLSGNAKEGLTVGNTSENGNRPFAGLIDELRIWASGSEAASAALTINELEAVRRFDAGLL